MQSGNSIAASGAAGHPDDSRVIVITPNCSLTPRTAFAFLAVTGGSTLLVALYMASRGLWPILPFAGLEIALLVWATLHSMRRGRDHEILEISDAHVTIEVIRGRDRQITVFPRHWTRVKLRGPQHLLHPSRLCLESQGRSCEVGRFLTEDERRGLAARLRELVGGPGLSPARSAED